MQNRLVSWQAICWYKSIGGEPLICIVKVFFLNCLLRLVLHTEGVEHPGVSSLPLQYFGIL